MRAMRVRITKAGDGMYQVGEVIRLAIFLGIVKRILEDGGEMPVAVPEPYTEAELNGCRIGYCAKKEAKYGGGWNQDLEEGRCPVCGEKLLERS